MRRLLLIAAVIALPASAQAGVQVLGGGYAARCWQATQTPNASDIRDCDRALASELLRPADRAATLVNRGVLRLRARDWERAVADFDRALAITPGLGEALVNRGAARIGQKRWDEGLADIDRALALAVIEPEKAWFNRALALEGKGDLRAARQAYLKAAELNPGWAAPSQELRRFSVRRQP